MATDDLTLSSLREVFGERAAQPRWVAWREIVRDGESRKVPVNPHTGGNASHSDRETWGTLEEALRRHEEDGLDGVGIVLGGGLGGIDLDACRDPETGELTDWAESYIEMFASYSEVSPSGTGVKVLALGAPDRLPASTVPMNEALTDRKRPALECYVSDRYFTITGEPLNGYGEIRETPEAWEQVAQVLEAHADGTGDREPREVTGNDEMSAALCFALSEDSKLKRLWKAGKGDGTDKSRNDASLAATLSHRGFEDADIEAALRNYPLGQIGTGKLTGEEADRQIGRLLGLAKRERKEPSRSVEKVNREPYDVDALLDAAKVEQTYIARPFLPEGIRGLNVGLPGVGKTNQTLQIGIQVAAGQDLFGVFPVDRHRRVLAVFAQDGPKVIGHRTEALLRGLGLDRSDLGDRFRTFCRPSLKLTDEEDMAWLREQVEGHDAHLLLLDSYKYVSTGSENAAEDVNANLTALTRLQDATGVTLMLVHHSRKPGEKDYGIRRIFTASGLVEFPAWATAAYHCSADNFGDPIEVVVELWDVPEQVETFQLHWKREEGGAFRLIHEKLSDEFVISQDRELVKAKERVAAYLKEHGPESKSMVYGTSSRTDKPQCPGNHRKNREALNLLIETGHVEVDPAGQSKLCRWVEDADETHTRSPKDDESDDEGTGPDPYPDDPGMGQTELVNPQETRYDAGSDVQGGS